MMEKYIARCEECGELMSLEKVINNGAILLKASYKCPHCGKRYTAEFDKFYDLDKHGSPQPGTEEPKKFGHLLLILLHN